MGPDFGDRGGKNVFLLLCVILFVCFSSLHSCLPNSFQSYSGRSDCVSFPGYTGLVWPSPGFKCVRVFPLAIICGSSIINFVRYQKTSKIIEP